VGLAPVAGDAVVGLDLPHFVDTASLAKHQGGRQATQAHGPQHADTAGDETAPVDVFRIVCHRITLLSQ